MKLLANENFPFASVKYLMEKGFDIKYIGFENHGIKDSEVIQFAIDEERTILNLTGTTAN